MGNLSIIMGMVLFFTSTSTAFAYHRMSIERILTVQPLLDQEQMAGDLDVFIPTNNDGLYQYYKLGYNSKKLVRSISKDDRMELEIQKKDGKWERSQIRFYKTGIIANYEKGRLLGYTRKLGNGILAYYQDREKAEADTLGKKGEIYLKFIEDGLYACYIDSLSQALKGTASMRIFSDGERYHVETKNSSGKWNLHMLIHPEKGIISNYKDRYFTGFSKINPIK